MRFLEEIIIRTCSELGVAANRRDGLTGVWVGSKKIASIGIGVRRWMTMHGLALNVERCSLEPFLHITPCGIVGVEMTCLEGETWPSHGLLSRPRRLWPTLFCKAAESFSDGSERSVKAKLSFGADQP